LYEAVREADAMLCNMYGAGAVEEAEKELLLKLVTRKVEVEIW
jgi:hypothetical protein